MERVQVAMWRGDGLWCGFVYQNWEDLSNTLFLTGRWRFVDDVLQVEVCEKKKGWIRNEVVTMWKDDGKFRFIQEFVCGARAE